MKQLALICFSGELNNFTQDDYDALYYACAGNPLHANEILSGYTAVKEQKFQDHLETFFEIEKCNIQAYNDYFLKDKDKDFKNEFYSMLRPYCGS